jgi:hypothetical protein
MYTQKVKRFCCMERCRQVPIGVLALQLSFWLHCASGASVATVLLCSAVTPYNLTLVQTILFSALDLGFIS